MRKKRVMVIGPMNCGKTTLVNALNDYDGPLRKTQDIIYGKNTIDAPGAYIESPWMYKHLIATAQDASHVLILVDQSRVSNVYPPGFVKAFRCPVIGVITKSDLMAENEDLCFQQLRQIGIPEPYYKISASSDVGMVALKEYLFTFEKKSKGGIK
ncbi:EutP/PduV family microcompartment system protein [Clostridium tagluense]|uniref:EutP/PduV family microcompartment system protein n=1 Tax=Clostridium tagluense TaxID=360422 RepID=UPI001C0E4E28|nr:EutP/PduV family microcompartment system protein [Clostridium tagluense]MBU3128293.1 EutP/PduV family microcompartment system protein [Clostridium tagluense]MCB2310778.1 EutP/PduV family microcompartment system protein [Clostridium tagluense]MCB2315492.1 EutP/PduV family microcompartment system protein [Clostridium tagluense]MCB2320345.1 EutP/PduV family microcompartment system protein [Clostridium tagluense]MCB2325371.1 EutP/PduV family microcompartment system protein [Clostridium tagluens